MTCCRGLDFAIESDRMCLYRMCEKVIFSVYSCFASWVKWLPFLCTFLLALWILDWPPFSPLWSHSIDMSCFCLHRIQDYFHIFKGTFIIINQTSHWFLSQFTWEMHEKVVVWQLNLLNPKVNIFFTFLHFNSRFCWNFENGKRKQGTTQECFSSVQTNSIPDASLQKEYL